MTLSFVARFVSMSLIWAGTAALACVGGAMGYAAIYQQYQSRTLERIIAARPLAAAATRVDSTDSAYGPNLRKGDPVGRLEIPRLGMSIVVFHGVDEKTLTLGVGHVPGTPLPGVEGNVALAAHRDTFFRPIKDIEPGDGITFSSEYGRFEYVVDSTEIVGPEETHVMESRGYGELTLITCYPFYFVGAAPERFVVHARRVNRTAGS